MRRNHTQRRRAKNRWFAIANAVVKIIVPLAVATFIKLAMHLSGLDPTI
jgi:hypothetical protein